MGKQIKACIFDLDGVIVDTAKYHYLAWKRLAEELGFYFSPEQNERLKGVSRMRSLEILLEVGGKKLSQKEMEKAADKKNRWYVEFISKITPDEILPGAYELLIELKTNKIKRALGSASKNARTILDRLELNRFFDAVIDGNKVSKAKPDPEVFLKAAEELKIIPEECIVFEDAQAGIEAAINGKMRCIGVGDYELLRQADLVVPNLANVEWKDLISALSH
jgi:beta-phosphoglucomutase